jgi:hypothetical protein
VRLYERDGDGFPAGPTTDEFIIGDLPPLGVADEAGFFDVPDKASERSSANGCVKGDLSADEAGCSRWVRIAFRWVLHVLIGQTSVASDLRT